MDVTAGSAREVADIYDAIGWKKDSENWANRLAESNKVEIKNYKIKNSRLLILKSYKFLIFNCYSNRRQT